MMGFRKNLNLYLLQLGNLRVYDAYETVPWHVFLSACLPVEKGYCEPLQNGLNVHPFSHDDACVLMVNVLYKIAIGPSTGMTR